MLLRNRTPVLGAEPVSPLRLVVALALAGLLLAGCYNSGASGQEQGRTQSGYRGLVARQPSHTMKYSSTRNTANFWADTWGRPGKLAYVYMRTDGGQLTGYYVLKGLPVSYCVSLTPPDRVDYGDSTGRVIRSAPSIDGVYYGSGDCDRYYGIDATTGAYVEWNTGANQTFLLYDQPLPDKPNVEPLGYTKVAKDGKLEKAGHK